MSITSELKFAVRCFLIGLAITAAVIFIASVLPGCTFGEDLSRAVRSFRDKNPTAGIVPVDQDGDGRPEFLAPDKDLDGKADLDAGGKPIEIAGTREPLAGAQNADADIAELFSLTSAVFVGTPAAAIFGLIGTWWGKRKPVSQMTAIIKSIDAAKQDDSPEGYITLSKDVLRTIQAERTELLDLIAQIRAKTKT